MRLASGKRGCAMVAAIAVADGRWPSNSAGPVESVSSDVMDLLAQPPGGGPRAQRKAMGSELHPKLFGFHPILSVVWFQRMNSFRRCATVAHVSVPSCN